MSDSPVAEPEPTAKNAETGESPQATAAAPGAEPKGTGETGAPAQESVNAAVPAPPVDAGDRDAQTTAANDGEEPEQVAAEAAGDSDPGGLGALSGLSDQVRATAKWLIGAFAAVGLLLIPGLQIANLGAVGGGKLAWALVSAGVGIVMVILAAWIIARLLTVQRPGYAELVSREKRRANGDPLLEVFDANRTLLQAEAATIEELRQHYSEAIAEREDAYSILNPTPALGMPARAVATEPSSEEVERAERQLEYAQARVDVLRPILDQLSSVAEFQDIRHQFRRSLPWIVLATVVAAGAFVSFALAVHTPAHATSDFNHARLANLDLSGANLTDADFKDAQLTGVDLHGSDLQNADFAGAHLTRVNLTGANTTGVNSGGAVLTMSTCVDGTLDGPPTASAAATTQTIPTRPAPKPTPPKTCFRPRPLKSPVADVGSSRDHGDG
jgi:Pentapeptide repeats (9 copies)